MVLVSEYAHHFACGTKPTDVFHYPHLKELRFDLHGSTNDISVYLFEIVFVQTSFVMVVVLQAVLHYGSSDCGPTLPVIKVPFIQHPQVWVSVHGGGGAFWAMSVRRKSLASVLHMTLSCAGLSSMS